MIRFHFGTRLTQISNLNCIVDIRMQISLSMFDKSIWLAYLSSFIEYNTTNRSKKGWLDAFPLLVSLNKFIANLLHLNFIFLGDLYEREGDWVGFLPVWKSLSLNPRTQLISSIFTSKTLSNFSN